MSEESDKLRALSLSTLVVLSMVAGSIAFSGAAAAAANTSISPDVDDADASGVTYTADGHFELANQKELQHVDVHLSPADVSDVGSGDVNVYIDGTEYTDGLTQFDASSGSVEFKLSNSRTISDGDRVRVVVADVTNPADDFDANATFHDTSDAEYQSYQDTVSIDTPSDISYHDLQFTDGTAAGNDTTITVGETLTVSATINNSGEQTGEYNASFEVDGDVRRYDNGTLDGMTNTTTSFRETFDATGTHDVTIKNLPATEVTVTEPLEIVDGSASPDQVTPGTTVNNQEVSVEVSNVSQDGDTDWHYVEFPNELASGLSVNSVDANATSITSSPNLVDGYDDDGTDETVKFATSGDGGGDIALNLTVDASVDYPDTETTYGVDARTEDSSGETATQEDIATISTGTAPTISAYSASNPSGHDVDVSFDSDEQLADISVDIVDSSGATVTTLTDGNFTETSAGGSYTYDATETLSADGDYDVVLNTAEDAAGNDGAAGQTQSVQINSAAVAIAGGTANPNQVTPGTTVNNQKVYVEVNNVSQDGDTDWHYVEFPNTLASGLSVNSVDANATNITSSPNLVDGYDNDDTTETVKFATSGDGGGDIALNLTVDVSVEYPDTETTYSIGARTEDSDGTVTQQDVTTIDVVQTSDGGSGDSSNSDDDNGSSDGNNGSSDGSTGSSDGSNGGSDGSTGGSDGSTGSSDGSTGSSDGSTGSSDGSNGGSDDGSSGSSGDDTSSADDGNSDSSDDSTGSSNGSDGSSDGSNGSSDDSSSDSSGDNTSSGDDGSNDSSDDGSNDNSSDDGSNDNSSDDNSNDGSNSGGDSNVQIGTVPSVTDITLTTADRSVVVNVTTNHDADTLQAHVDGPTESELTRADFTETEQDAGYAYTANVGAAVPGSFEATVDRIGADRRRRAAGQTATLVVSLPDHVDPTAVAAPPGIGNSDSIHTVTMPVTADATVTNETLTGLDVEYSGDFLDSGGSISSVSDDQNVATLLVVDANGTVQSRMGGTDAVSVNVADNSVQLDLSDVDSARTPALDIGDRVIVRLRPVTNPATAGDYETTVHLESAAGNSEALSTTVRIRDQSEIEAFAAKYVAPTEDQATVDLTQSNTLGTVTIGSVADAGGTVRAIVPADSPAIADDLSAPVVTTLNLSRPDAAADDQATITAEVHADEFTGDASALTLSHYDETGDSWDRLPTSVVDRSDGSVTIRATASGTSTFAVTSDGSAQDQQQQIDQQPDQQTADQQPDQQTDQQTANQPTPEDGETTAASILGFGTVLAAIAIIGAALVLLYYRRERE